MQEKALFAEWEKKQEEAENEAKTSTAERDKVERTPSEEEEAAKRRKRKPTIKTACNITAEEVYAQVASP